MRTWIKTPLDGMPAGFEGGLVIEGAKIVELLAARAQPATSVDEIFDASDHVITPGLINTHHHFYQTLTRAFRPAIDKKLFDWLTALYPVWAKIGAEDFRVAVQVALAELLLSGCTTAADHHYLFSRHLLDPIDIAFEEAERFGVRVALTRGSMDLSIRDGGLPPDRVTQSIDVILDDSERLVNRWRQAGDGAMRQIALAPCSPFSVTTDLMRESAALAERLDVRLHTHLAETEDENQFCLAKFGKRPLDYLDELGWIGPRVWFAHGIHFTADEMRRLGAAGCGVAHCPSSNMLLGSGACPVGALEAAGVAVGLAVDGSASSDSSNLIQEVRQALFVARGAGGIAAATMSDALRWATEGSAKCLGRSDIGQISVGKQADLALFKLDELRFAGADSPLAALVTCGAHRADRVMVAGQWRVIGGAIPGLDVDALIAKQNAAARRVLTAL